MVGASCNLVRATPAPALVVKVGAVVTERNVDILSEGVRLSGTVYFPTASGAGTLPTVIMSHGWGGVASQLRGQAMALATAGYLVIAFDYRGWGSSDSKVILTAPAPDAARKTDHRFTAEVLELREMVDPLDQAEDIFNVIHWAMGEPRVDRERVGLWGTSFSGGLVVHVAAQEPRVKALVSQVGYMGSPLEGPPPPALQGERDAGTRRTHGTIGYPPPRAREVGTLQGGPVGAKFLRYAPIDEVASAKRCAMLFIAAEHEELFDNRQNPQLAHERAVGPKRYVVIPNISHYGVYGQARDQTMQLAIEWFDAHLKP